jgi:hypothetical protein
MAFRICNSLLSMSTVCKREGQIAHLPVSVLSFLEELDVHVRDGHGKPVIEAHATERQTKAQCRHARHVFCDGDAIWVQSVKHLICQHEIDNAVLVHPWSEVFMISSREASVSGELLGHSSKEVIDSRPNAMVGINHASNAVKSEAIKLILLHPES